MYTLRRCQGGGVRRIWAIFGVGIEGVYLRWDAVGVGWRIGFDRNFGVFPL